MKHVILAFLLISFFSTAVAHPIKMSTGKIVYNKDLGVLVLAVNLFQDDFSEHLKKVYRLEKINFFDSDKQTREVVADYINKGLSIKINGNKMPLQFHSIKSIEDNVVQVKLHIPLAKGSKIRQLDIYNELLFEAFKDQVNVVHEDLDGDGASNIFRFYPGDAHKAIAANFICK